MGKHPMIPGKPDGVTVTERYRSLKSRKLEVSAPQSQN